MSSIQNKIYTALGARKLFMYQANISQGEVCMKHRLEFKKIKIKTQLHIKYLELLSGKKRQERRKKGSLLISSFDLELCVFMPFSSCLFL